MAEGHRVLQVHDLALRPRHVFVNEHKFGGQAAKQSRIGKTAADLAGAHNCDFYRLNERHSLPPSSGCMHVLHRQGVELNSSRRLVPPRDSCA